VVGHLKVNNNAVSAENKHTIQLLRQTKQYGAKHLLSMFPEKQWSLGGLKKLIRKINDTGTVDRRSAPAHRVLETVELLKVETPDFIPLNLWPPNSADLNPVDYKIWGLLQERVYRTGIKDVDELRRRIAEEWDKLDQRIIDKAAAERRKRLRACVAAGGGQFEHKM